MSSIHLSWDARSFADCQSQHCLNGGRTGTYESDELDIAFLEFTFQLCECAELCRAYWGEICRMREQYCPFVADPLVEVDIAMCGFGLEVRCNGPESQAWLFLRGSRE